MDFSLVVNECQNSNIGKLLPTALYVHCSALDSLAPILQQHEQAGREIIVRHYQKRQGIELSQSSEPLKEFTLVKFDTQKPQISYLFYRNFERDPHPKLEKSIIVNLATQQVVKRQYQRTENPPILHRKEAFVASGHPLSQEFAWLTQQEEALGLLDNPRYLGNSKQWQQLLIQHKLSIKEHRIVCLIDPPNNEPELLPVDRHKLAREHEGLSHPLQIALELGIFKPGSSFFDYGCGHGQDIKEMRARGYQSQGWDPHHESDTDLAAADIVNLGYVIEVIEDLSERRQVLAKAWELTNKVLIVATQVLVEDRKQGLVAYADGTITKCRNSHKYYEQNELKAYIDSILNVDAVPVGLGIFLVFKEYPEAEVFRASYFSSKLTLPPICRQVPAFDAAKDLLLPLMDFYLRRGRFPVKDEFPQEAALKAEFKTYRRAFKLILQATDKEEWEKIVEKRRQDLLVYLALANFKGRPSIRKIAGEIKADTKALLAGYRQACEVADLLLASARDLKKVAYLCSNSSVGKQLPGAIAIHRSALSKLPALLRVYEGCASRIYGRLKDANIIKLYYDRPKVSYLFYPDFDQVAHPTLQTTMEVNLNNQSVLYNDLSQHPNPLVLHHKDALVAPSYQRYEEFQQLVNSETQLGLLRDRDLIRRQEQWQKHLEQHRLEIRDHSLACTLSYSVDN